MGTNYYVEPQEPCPHCGRPFDRLHIGKSSGGWCFSLHVMPDLNINNLEDWKKVLSKPNTVIKNEYGEEVSYDELISIITDREGNVDPNEIRVWRNYYKDWDDFHRSNYSEFGPKGLLRHKLDREHCVGHGEGTWDYIVGEFS